MIAIASHSVATSCAADCTAADVATSNDPAASDRRSPIRSMIWPAGGAVTMYSSAHAPSANPSVLRLTSSSVRTCVTIGGIASRTSRTRRRRCTSRRTSPSGTGVAPGRRRPGSRSPRPSPAGSSSVDSCSTNADAKRATSSWGQAGHSAANGGVMAAPGVRCGGARSSAGARRPARWRSTSPCRCRAARGRRAAFAGGRARRRASRDRS